MTQTEEAGSDSSQDPPLVTEQDRSRELPTTARGARTRAALVAAARVIFERDGYLESRLTDITREARCSTGSFYTYFSSKEEILTAVLETAQHDMLHPGIKRVLPEDADPVALIEASHRAYFEAYRRNAQLMVVFEQVALINPHFRAMKGRRGESFRERNARSIANLQERGLADPSLDPYRTALALNGMVGRLAWHAFGLELEETLTVDDLVETATQLWANALKLAPTTTNT
ncbi:TetR/AcrR family transcriptional regulator [Aeromicrobium sp. CTD01-1L150]|uniref:TetR/AcrR family transcriptional regulator n=1 Tax=Aeromicrobium sp. CTD01-1L150 TaxID=3341830 RepID=UPI0035C222B6